MTRNSLLLDLTGGEESIIFFSQINKKYLWFVQYINVLSSVEIPRLIVSFYSTG